MATAIQHHVLINRLYRIAPHTTHPIARQYAGSAVKIVMVWQLSGGSHGFTAELTRNQEVIELKGLFGTDLMDEHGSPLRTRS